MVRSLTVFYLHRANRLDARRLPVVEYGLTDAFRDFCRETFDTVADSFCPPNATQSSNRHSTPRSVSASITACAAVLCPPPVAVESMSAFN